MFASPIRRRVIVSWAFVGTPLSIVLKEVSSVPFLLLPFDLLPELKKTLPIRNVAIQQVQSTPDERITEEAKPDTSGAHFHDHRRCSE